MTVEYSHTTMLIMCFVCVQEMQKQQLDDFELNSLMRKKFRVRNVLINGVS